MSSPINLSSITAVILAGGMGTRLQPVVHDRPKILADICGRPYITYLFDQLINAGARDVVLCTGYMSDSVYKTLGSTYQQLNIRYSEESTPLGTGGALQHALPLITSDPVLVMNGDSYANVALNDFANWFFLKERDAAVLLTHVSDASRYGKVIVSEDERLLVFEEKAIDNSPGWINAGLYMLTKKLISQIPKNMNFSLENEFFPQLIGKNFFGYSHTGKFIDIGTPASYQEAQNFFKEVS
jgi:D-glycero-alpha-D-manno-heptose 1-phosphate guanylyltransferase